MAAFDYLSTQVTARIICRPFLYLVPGTWSCRDACTRLPRPAGYHNWFDFGVVNSRGKVCGTYNTCGFEFEDLGNDIRGFPIPVDPLNDEFSRPLIEEMTALTPENTIDANTRYETCITREGTSFVADDETVIGVFDIEDCLKPVGAAVFLTLILEIEKLSLEICRQDPALFRTLTEDRQQAAHDDWWERGGKEIEKKVRVGNEGDPEWTEADLETFMNSDDIIAMKIDRTMLVDRINMALHPIRESGRWATSKSKTKSLINKMERVRNGLAHARVSTVGKSNLEQSLTEQIENESSLSGHNPIKYGEVFSELKELHDALMSQVARTDK